MGRETAGFPMIGLLPALVVASGLAGDRVPGQLLAAVNAGTTLQRHKMSMSVSAEWLPFSGDAWGALGEMGARAELMGLPVRDGNLTLALWVGYGKPKYAFWFSFEAGAGTAVGWHADGSRPSFLPATMLAALRLGYGPVALRLVEYVSADGAFLHDDYFTLSLEGLLGV